MTAPVVLDVQGEYDIVNTSTETDLLSYTVPGGTLGSVDALRVSIKADYLNQNGGAAAVFFVLKIKYGATTMYNDTTAQLPDNTMRRSVLIDFILFPKNSTSSQSLSGHCYMSTDILATTGTGDLATDEMAVNVPFVGATASEDSTANQDLKVTVQHTTTGGTGYAHASVSMRRLYSIIEEL